MQAENALEARPIYPAGDLASVIAGNKHRADLLQGAAKRGGFEENFKPGASPVGNVTPAPAQVGAVGGNTAAEYIGLGQALID